MSTFLGMPGPPASPDSDLTGTRPFPAAARDALGNSRLRRNLSNATEIIRGKRANVVGEVADWEELREAGAAIKASALARLPALLEQLDHNLKITDGVLRHRIIKLRPGTPDPPDLRPSAQPATETAEAEPAEA